MYGSDEINIKDFIQQNPIYGKTLIEDLPYTEAEVIWAVHHEMARTVEDVLARRLRLLFLDADAAIKSAQTVAELIAAELNYNQTWQDAQVKSFSLLAAKYLIAPIA